jgi:hypothetical protein
MLAAEQVDSPNTRDHPLLIDAVLHAREINHGDKAREPKVLMLKVRSPNSSGSMPSRS